MRGTKPIPFARECGVSSVNGSICGFCLLSAAFSCFQCPLSALSKPKINGHDGNATRDRADVFAATTDTTFEEVVSVVAANIRQLAGEFAAPV